MTSEQIERLFCADGYHKTPSNLPEFTFYWRKEHQGITVILVIDYRREIFISVEQYAHVKEKIVEFFRARGEGEIHMLSLIVSPDMEKAKRLCVTDSFCWVLDSETKRLIIYENQAEDFYGLRKKLEDFLAGSLSAPDIRRSAKLPWVNICLVAVNVVVFLICTFTGDLLYNKGAFGIRQITADRSYYRMITSMFLHSDINHLFGNMIVLYGVGEIVEKETGHIPYVIIYFLSGIAGDIFSMGYELLSGDYYSSVGASGAVFGVEGALLVLLIMHRGRPEQVTLRRLVIAIVFSLYCGFTESNVNNAAHIGGVLMGFAATAVIMMLEPRIRTGKDRDINEN